MQPARNTEAIYTCTNANTSNCLSGSDTSKDLKKASMLKNQVETQVVALAAAWMGVKDSRGFGFIFKDEDLNGIVSEPAA